MDTKKLRQKILDLAIHGKLVPQDPNDEPASVLLERIRAEKESLIKEGKIKRAKKATASDTSHYENVPFEVPDGWCWCRIDGIGEVVTGSTPSKDNVDYYGGNIPFYKPTDLEQGINTVEASDSLTELGFSVSRQLPEQSILVTCIGATIGKIGMIQRKGACNQQINAVITNESITPKFLYYACISGYMQGEIKGRASATTLPILNKNKFSEIPIPIPPIQEQKRIVAEVDNLLMLVDEMDLCSQDLTNYISLTKSRILDLAIHGKLVPQDVNDEPASELLKRINPKANISCDNTHYENSQLPDGWLELPISEFCDSINGLWTGKKPPFVNVGVIRNANFTKDFRLDYSKIEYIDVESKAFAKRHLIDGDLIVEKSGGSDNNPVGRSILYEGPDGTYSYSNFTMVLRVQNRKLVLSKYLYFFLMAIYIRGDMRKMQTQTTGLHNLILDSFMSIMVPIPPLQEQNKIITKIETMFLALESIATILH